MSNRIWIPSSARHYFSEHASLICDLRMKTTASKEAMIDQFHTPYANMADYLVVAQEEVCETEGNWGFLENQD